MCQITFTDGAQASAASTALQASLEQRESFKAGRVTGFHALVVGSTLFVESIPEPDGKLIIEACAAAFRAKR